MLAPHGQARRWDPKRLRFRCCRPPDRPAPTNRSRPDGRRSWQARHSAQAEPISAPWPGFLGRWCSTTTTGCQSDKSGWTAGRCPGWWSPEVLAGPRPSRLQRSSSPRPAGAACARSQRSPGRTGEPPRRRTAPARTRSRPAARSPSAAPARHARRRRPARHLRGQLTRIEPLAQDHDVGIEQTLPQPLNGHTGCWPRRRARPAGLPGTPPGPCQEHYATRHNDELPPRNQPSPPPQRINSAIGYPSLVTVNDWPCSTASMGSPIQRASHDGSGSSSDGGMVPPTASNDLARPCCPATYAAAVFWRLLGAAPAALPEGGRLSV